MSWSSENRVPSILVKTKVDANGTTTTMTYDELDRMTAKSYVPGSSPPASYVTTPTVTYTYDDANVPYSNRQPGGFSADLLRVEQLRPQSATAYASLRSLNLRNPRNQFR